MVNLKLSQLYNKPAIGDLEKLGIGDFFICSSASRIVLSNRHAGPWYKGGRALKKPNHH